MRFGTLVFDRPKGPQTDVKELEFVSALMQTDKVLRPDGTLKPQDVTLFLQSRFGLAVDEETVERLIFKDLAGWTIPTEESTIDLCQLVALLSIPSLLEGTKSEVHGTNRDLLDWFVKTYEEASGGAGRLTRKSLREVFESYDEFGVPDNVLDAMIKAAGGPQGSIERALISDLDLFNLDWKNQHTTNFEDALNAQPLFPALEVACPEQAIGKTQDASLLKQKITLPFIDFVAENYRRPLYVMVLWGCGVVTYMAYIFSSTISGGWAEIDCDEANLSEVGCSIVQGIVSWLAIMVQLTTLGFVYIVFGSFGNSIFASLYKTWSLAGILIAMVIVALSTIVPYFVEVETPFFSTVGNKYTYEEQAMSEPEPEPTETSVPTMRRSETNGSPNNDAGFGRNLEEEDTYVVKVEYNADTDLYSGAYYLSLFLGCILAMMLLVDLLVMIVPHFFCALSKVQELFTAGGLKAEANQQKAAFVKSSQMLQNALSIHGYGENGSGKLRKSVAVRDSQSNKMQALLQYQVNDLEASKDEVGGSLWTWRKILNGSLSQEEGVWIHSRLLACTMAQLIIVVGICVLAAMAYKNADQFVYSTNESIDAQANRILTEHLNKTYQCANDAYAKITGDSTGVSASKKIQDGDSNIHSAVKLAMRATGASTQGQQLLRPLIIDQVMAYDEYWWPDEDANFLAHVLYNFTNNAILDCFSQEDEEATFKDEMNRIRWCIEENSPYWLHPTYMFQLQYEEEFGGPEAVKDLLISTCGASDYYVLLLTNTTYDEVEENEDGWSDLAETLELSQSDYKLVVSFAFISSLAVAMFLAFVTIPSYVSQVLRFRAGDIPSLDDLSFLQLRKALDLSTTLFASSFWGSLFTSLASGIVVGGIILCFVSPVSGQVGRTIFAAIVGFAVVMVFRLVLLLTLRGCFFTNLYRKNVGGSNIFFVVLEAWNVALSVGFIVGRIIKVLLVSMFFIARIDTAILAPGVGRVGPIEADHFPYTFRKDIVMHEAHRHPYIESFGLLCLLKLRARDSFGNRANACWRLLFVLTLMPWLKKYRVSGYEEGTDIAELQDKISVAEDAPRRHELEGELDNLVKRHKKSEEVEVEEMKRELQYLRKRVKSMMDAQGPFLGKGRKGSRTEVSLGTYVLWLAEQRAAKKAAAAGASFAIDKDVKIVHIFQGMNVSRDSGLVWDNSLAEMVVVTWVAPDGSRYRVLPQAIVAKKVHHYNDPLPCVVSQEDLWDHPNAKTAFSKKVRDTNKYLRDGRQFCDTWNLGGISAAQILRNKQRLAARPICNEDGSGCLGDSRDYSWKAENVNSAGPPTNVP